MAEQSKKGDPTQQAQKPTKDQDFSLLTNDDLFLFNEGSHYRLYLKLGSHLASVGGTDGVYFAVWAPNARYVSVVGDFNGWDRGSNPLGPRGQSGIWEGFVPGSGEGGYLQISRGVSLQWLHRG